ncbi:MAG: hypothetical protein ACR2MB_03395 [Acidimicrobiales bacterium]
MSAGGRAWARVTFLWSELRRLRPSVLLAWRELTRRRGATVAAGALGIVAGSTIVRSPEVGSAALPPAAVAAVLLFAVPAALAAGTNPAQRHEAEVLLRLGSRRYVVRLAVTLAVAGATAIPAVVAVVIAAAVGIGDADTALNALVAAVLCPPAGALLTSGSRLPEVPRSRRTGIRTALRASLGVAAIALGYWTGFAMRSGNDVDVYLPLALAVVFGGLYLLAPLLIDVFGWTVHRAPGFQARLAGAEVRRVRRALTVPVALTACAACLLVVEAVLGAGLHQREEDRSAAIAAIGPGRAGRSGHELLVGCGGGPFRDACPDGHDSVVGPAGLTAQARRLAPRATVAEVRGLGFLPRSAKAVFGDVTRNSEGGSSASRSVDVALATPELLRTLRLDPAMAHGHRALVLDRRVLRADGTTRLAPTTLNPFDEGRARAFPARLVVRDQLPALLPAVLLPRRLISPRTSRLATSLVLRFPTRPTDREVTALRDGLDVPVIRGDQRIDVAATNRTDDLDLIAPRSGAEVGRFTVSLGIASALAVLVAQAALSLAHRRDDEILHLLGSARPAVARVAALRGVLIGAAGTVVGAAVGFGGTLVGLAHYARYGRFSAPDPLLAIPVVVPPAVLVAIVVLPLLSAAIGAALASTRPLVDPTRQAERLAW